MFHAFGSRGRIEPLAEKRIVRAGFSTRKALARRSRNSSQRTGCGFTNAALDFRKGHGGLRGARAELTGERERLERGLPFKRGGTHTISKYISV